MGPIWNNPVLDPIAVLHLDNRLSIIECFITCFQLFLQGTLREKVEKIERVFLGEVPQASSTLGDMLDSSGYVSSMNLSSHEEEDTKSEEQSDKSTPQLQNSSQEQSEIGADESKNIKESKKMEESESVEEKEKKRQSDNATPTEVFKVVASCVT